MAVNSVVVRLLARDGRDYAKVVEHASVDTLMAHIQSTTHNDSADSTDAFN